MPYTVTEITYGSIMGQEVPETTRVVGSFATRAEAVSEAQRQREVYQHHYSYLVKEA